MPNRPLSRAPHAGRPHITLAPGIALTAARVHEACGPARHSFAMMVAAQTQGTVFWIAPEWQSATLNPDGMAQHAAPGRFVFIRPRRAEDILWTLEETLRSGLVPLAVAELPEPPGLTAVRRLHLAAESGMASRAAAPLGLLLTPADGGAPGIESRWHMAPAHVPGATQWQLSRRRARTSPQKEWQIHCPDGRFTPHSPAPA